MTDAEAQSFADTGSKARKRLALIWVFFSYLIFIYLFMVALGLSCSTWDLLLQRTGFSLVVAQSYLPRGMWDVGPGIEPRPPALQADSLPVKPQGKPQNTGVGGLSLL